MKFGRLIAACACVPILVGAGIARQASISAGIEVPEHPPEFSGPPGIATIALQRDAAFGASSIRLRTPTDSEPLRVYYGGDSMAGYPGSQMEGAFPPDLPVELQSEAVISSGLITPWFFDWPAHLQEIVAEFDPDVVVLSMGGNDNQGFEGTAFDSSGWTYEYRRRLVELVEVAGGDDRLVIWVGMPPMLDEELNAAMPVLNEVTSSAMGDRMNSAYVDAWTIFATEDGSFTQFVDAGDTVVNARAADGVHYTFDGASLLSDEVAAIVLDAISPP